MIWQFISFCSLAILFYFYYCHFDLVLLIYFTVFFLFCFISTPVQFLLLLLWLNILAVSPLEGPHHPAWEPSQIGLAGGHRFIPQASESPLQIEVTGDCKFTSERSWIPWQLQWLCSALQSYSTTQWLQHQWLLTNVYLWIISHIHFHVLAHLSFDIVDFASWEWFV